MDLAQLGRSERRVVVRVGGQAVPVLLRVLGDRSAVLEHGLATMQATLARAADGPAARRQLKAIAALPPTEIIEALLAWEAPRLTEEMKVQTGRGARVGVAPQRDPRETEAAFRQRQAEHRAAQTRAARGADRAAAAELARRLDARRGELATLPAETLAQRALAAWREAEGLLAFERALEEYTLFAAVRKLKTGGRYFRSVRAVRELHPRVRERLLHAYRRLDSGDPEVPFG